MTILVTGASGNVGGAVLRALARSNRTVRAMSRDPKRIPLAGVEVVRADFNDADSLEAAFDGVEALHLINFDAASGEQLRDPEQVVGLAKAAGVKRVTTFRGMPRGALEEALVYSRLDWTDFFIPVEFMTNTLQWTTSIRIENVIRAFGPTRSAMIHEADIGAAIAAALLTGDHAGKTYTLTGPDALTPRDKVEIISRVMERPITLIELEEDEARAKWRSLGTPEPFIDFLVDWHVNTPANGYTTTSDVEQIIGRKPQGFEQWVAENAHLFDRARSVA